ncbi:MAG: mechanosensitive ion channel [Candidatus Methanoperedens sp.]|nr:mechanosensitive ion channel [Candidatus Methanoperedens sp.]
MSIQDFILPLIILTSGFVIANILNFVLETLRKKAETTETKLDDILIHALGRPLYILVIVIGIYYAIHETPYLGDMINRFDDGYRYRHFILTIFGTWIVASLVKNIIREYGYEYAAQTESQLDDRLVALADMSATYIVWLIGIMIALGAVGIEITPLITGMGIAGLAIALAAQNLLSNVFGGVTITLDQLYKIGDRIELSGVYGDVYEIKPRYTKIKTLDNMVITIPNSSVINEKITNYADPDTTVRVKIPISVAYGTDPKKVDELLLDIAAKTPHVMKNPKPSVRFTEYASSSQNFELLVWIRHYDDRHPVLDSIFREMFARFKKEGIEIPYNQMDVHIKKDK